jgi:hypothetical protein
VGAALRVTPQALHLGKEAIARGASEVSKPKLFVQAALDEFGPADREEMKRLLPPALGRRVLLVSGRDLHWYGAHMVRGLKALSARLSRVRAALI